MKKQLFNLFLQIIPVMIGVYLAFAITNWNEQQKRRNDAKTFVKIVSQELSINKAKLELVIDYHKILRDSARHYIRIGKKISGPPDFFKGIRTQKLLMSAYKTGIQTGIINELDLTRIQELDLLYSYQEDYNDFTKMVLAGIINMDFQGNPESSNRISQFMAVSMTDIVIKEEELLKRYERIEKTLNEK